MGVDTHERRIKAVREHMAAIGVELAIFYSDSKHSFLDMDPILYLSNFKSMGCHAALFLPKDDEPILLISPSWDLDRALNGSFIKKIIATDEFVEGFHSIIQKNNWQKARAGQAGTSRQTKAIASLIDSQFESPPQDIETTVKNLAGIRDELEMTLARKAVEIADHGYQYLLQIAKPGILEYELAAEVDCYVKSLGAEDNFQILSASQHAGCGYVPTDRRLDVGDTILAEISPSCGGQFIQVCRTAVLGSISAIQLDKYQVLVDSMRAGMEAGVPKAKASDVTRAMNAIVKKAGYGLYSSPPYMRVRGHGLGFGSPMPGDFSLDNHTSLEEGMMFIIHPNQYIPETGYLLCGETVVVTREGLRPLTTRDFALDSIPV